MNPWLTELQAVAHDAGCGSGAHITTEYGFPHLTRDPCSCSRDARIAAGVEAARASDTSHRLAMFLSGMRVSCACGWTTGDGGTLDEKRALFNAHRDAAAYAAFRAATKEGT
jgi:hypothetical protein